MYETVKTKLENFPDFRERKNRVKYLCILALRYCSLDGNFKENQGLNDYNELAEFAMAYTSYDRAWRKCLQDIPELRGSDYGEEDGTKEMLEVEKQRELGYPV